MEKLDGNDQYLAEKYSLLDMGQSLNIIYPIRYVV